jgi:hypothetical protein
MTKHEAKPGQEHWFIEVLDALKPTETPTQKLLVLQPLPGVITAPTDSDLIEDACIIAETQHDETV